MAIERPPRSSGNIDQDFVAVMEYLNALFNEIDGVLQAAAGTVDVSNLPDPANTTLAQAQQTANEAFTAAAAAQADADTGLSRIIAEGEITIADTATSGTLTFDEEHEDADYRVVASVSAVSGAVSPNSLLKNGETKAVTGVTINIHTAPGVGTSVTYTVLVIDNF